MEILLSILIGIGLSAACGFRVFVPLLIMSFAALHGYLKLSPEFEWIGTYYAFIALLVATICEILSYNISWLDNLLDTIATPAAIIAGTIVTASVIQDISPFLKWTLAIIAGGGVAGTIQVGTVALRGKSSITTGGTLNPLISISELVSSTIISIISIIVPILAVIIVGIFITIFLYRFFYKRKSLRE